LGISLSVSYLQQRIGDVVGSVKIEEKNNLQERKEILSDLCGKRRNRYER